MVRQALGHVLEVANYRVVPARNQHEAFREFSRQPSEQPIDLVLLDLNPRDEDAWETADRLTALRPSLAVVAMTGRWEEQVSTSIPHLFDALIEKPLNLFLLLKTLDDLTLETPALRRPCESRYRATKWKPVRAL